jgi:hypothetical protein
MTMNIAAILCGEGSSSHSSPFFRAAGLLAVFFISREQVRRFELGIDPAMHGRRRETPADPLSTRHRNARGPSRLLKIWIVRAIFVVFAGKQPE